MVQTVAESVLGLVDRIDAIEHETEDIYLRLGKVFQAVKAAVDSSSREAEHAVQRVLNEHHGGTSIETAKRRSKEFIEDATRFFEKASQSEQNFLSGVERGIENLSKLDGIISRVRADSEEMEIISLNAMTVALKSGAAGRAFSVITDELKRLSGRTIKHADELSHAGTDLLERLNILKKTLSELSETQTSFFTSARSALENGFVNLENDVDGTARAIRSLSADSAGVKGPISTIMQEVQLQDIIRQSLDHVRLSLKAAEPDTSQYEEQITEDEEHAFLLEITRLSSSLLDDVSRQVRASLERFRSGMDGVNAVMSAVEMARFAMVAERTASRVGGDYRARAQAYIAAKESALVDAGAICSGVKMLEEKFKGINTILAKFKSIVTASRIETARNRALAIVSTTVTGMMELTDSLSDDVENAGGVTRSFGKALSMGMTDYLSDADETIVALRKEIDSLQAEFDRMSDSRRRLWETESNFRPFSDKFTQAVSEATESVDRIAVLAAELEGMRDALATYANAAGNSSVQVSASSIHSDRLKEIVNRFTIFEHKQTAARIASLDPEEEDISAESGDVTLF